MSKIKHQQPEADEVFHSRGELRKPQDRHNQPGQGGTHTPPNDGHQRDIRRDPEAEPRVETAPMGTPARLRGGGEDGGIDAGTDDRAG